MPDIRTGDCNCCGAIDVPVRFAKLDADKDDEAWADGAYYCEKCWTVQLMPSWTAELGSPAPEFWK